MGAETFITVATGTDAKTAFQRAVSDAAYEHGHGGYTGTIAEKDEFTLIPEHKNGLLHHDAIALAERMCSEDHHLIADKWGPAGCIPILEPDAPPRADGSDKPAPGQSLDEWLDAPVRQSHQFVFFGWASS
jgi:hypothetical protein